MLFRQATVNHPIIHEVILGLLVFVISIYYITYNNYWDFLKQHFYKTKTNSKIVLNEHVNDDLLGGLRSIRSHYHQKWGFSLTKKAKAIHGSSQEENSFSSSNKGKKHTGRDTQ